MKNLKLLLVGSVGFASVTSAQNLVSYWDQNSNTLPGGGFGYTTSAFPQAADLGNGTLTLGNFNDSFTNDGTSDNYDWIQSFGGTTDNAFGGAGSGGSFSPQGGEDLGSGPSNNGMYFDLNVDTTGYSGITVSWAQRGTGSGFASREFSYSSDGGSNFNVVGTDTGALSSTWTIESYDLTAVTALDENASVIFRVALDGATGSTGNNRFDNILVTAAVPEPSTYAAILGLLGLGFVMMRRRKA